MNTTLKTSKTQEQKSIKLIVDGTKLATLGFNTFTGAFNHYVNCNTHRLSWSSNLILATLASDHNVAWVFNLDNDHVTHVDTIMVGDTGTDVTAYIASLDEVVRPIAEGSIIVPKDTLSLADIRISVSAEPALPTKEE